MIESNERDKGGNPSEAEEGFWLTPYTGKNSKRNTDGTEVTKAAPAIRVIALDTLVPFADHPFKLYEGQRFTDMVESVRASGVITPIVVRPHPTEEGKYEILSGHNRVAAAKEAGLEDVPAILRQGLTDDEALLIVTETNLIQRSFADLLHSERATALAVHYEAMKKKSGYRSDLLQEIDELTGSPVANRKRTMDKLGEQHGLSKDTIARYLRVAKLIPALQKRLDNGEIAMRAAVSLSYLRDGEQKIIEGLLDKGSKINTEQAETLRKKSAEGPLGKTAIREILKPPDARLKTKSIKLSSELFSRHFKDGQSAEEIEGVIAEALEMYSSSRNGTI